MTYFESEIEKIRPALSVPYPERTQFLKELISDMESFYDEMIARGIDSESAKLETIAKFKLQKEDYLDIESIHRTLADKFFNVLPKELQTNFGRIAKLGMLLGFGYILFLEAPMREFFHQAGPVVYLIIALGLTGLAVQLGHFFRWFLKKDHSNKSLEQNSSIPLVIAFVIFLLGILNTTMGYYTVLTKWAANIINFDQMRIGLSEPLPNLVVATALAICIASLYAVTQFQLRSQGVPKVFLPNA